MRHSRANPAIKTTATIRWHFDNRKFGFHPGRRVDGTPGAVNNLAYLQRKSGRRWTGKAQVILLPSFE